MSEMKFDFKLSSSSGTEEKMKKRMLSFLLCLVMVLGLVPVSTFVEAASSGEHGDHCVCGASACGNTEHGGKLTWKPISNLNSIYTAGNYT